MLVELSSPVFKEKGKTRDIIKFHEGLNVILGKEDGENSIGKSSALLAIDFAFGGATYITSDGVKHMGHHPVFFRFKFPGEDRRFARHTDDPDRIHYCDENYNLTGAVITKNQFVDWLKRNYGIDFPELKFRPTVSGFFRIYGKHNYDETHPLCGRPAQNMQESIEVLEKLFDRYKDIEVFHKRMKDADAELKIYNDARKHDFISNLVGGKDKFEENEARIRYLENKLDTLMTSQVEQHTDEDIHKGEEKAALISQKIRLETERDSLQRRRRLLDVSLEYGLYPTENDMAELQKFFPSVNLRKLYEVEKYHQKLARILDEQFTEERQELDARIQVLKQSISELQEKINELGITENISKEFLDRHAELNREIYALRNQNEAYTRQTELQDAKKTAVDRLRRATETILFEIEKILNDKMEEFNDSLYEEKRKPPHLHFKAYNSYSFETPDDTGAGSNYKGMVIYDLAVLFSTALPALAHDSNILKNIGDKPVNGIMKIYEKSTKQIFIAFDKQAAYMPDTQRILEKNTVLHLSDGGCELYGESWNKEVSEQ